MPGIAATTFSSPSSLTSRTLGLLRSSPDGVDWSNGSGFALTTGSAGFGYSAFADRAASDGACGSSRSRARTSRPIWPSAGPRCSAVRRERGEALLQPMKTSQLYSPL